MRNKTLIVMGAILALVAFQSCSSKPEQSLLQSYFHAVTLNDNATMSSMALEPMEMEVGGWEILTVSEEKVEAAFLSDLSKKEADLKKQLENHIGPTIDAKDALDVAKDELDTARTKAAKQAAQKKVDEMQAKYDQEFNLHRELQKNYNDAKTAAAKEEEITAFSLGRQDLLNLRDLTGEVRSKQVEIKVKNKTGGEKSYLLYLRNYNLRDEAANLTYRGRWIIVRFEPLV